MKDLSAIEKGVWRIHICKEISKQGQRNDVESIIIQYVHYRKINPKIYITWHDKLSNKAS